MGKGHIEITAFRQRRTIVLPRASGGEIERVEDATCEEELIEAVDINSPALRLLWDVLLEGEGRGTRPLAQSEINQPGFGPDLRHLKLHRLCVAVRYLRAKLGFLRASEKP